MTNHFIPFKVRNYKTTLNIMLDLLRSSEVTLASQSLVEPWLVGQLVADQLFGLEPAKTQIESALTNRLLTSG